MLSAVTIPLAIAVVVATALAARSLPAPPSLQEDAKTTAVMPAALPPPTSSPSEWPSPPEALPFDRDAALVAIRGAESRALACKHGGDPTPPVEAFVTFGPDGEVLHARIAGDLERTSVGGCLLKVLRTATVPPFAGAPVTVKRRIARR